MSWKESAQFDSASWRSVTGYADARIQELTQVCTAGESSDTQIRQAQAGILELQRLKSLPGMVQAEIQIRGQQTARKEY